MIDAGILALLAVGIGLAIAHGLTSLFRGTRLLWYVGPLDDLALDWRAVGFAACAGALTVLVAAVVPTLLASRSAPQAGLRTFVRGGSRYGRRLRGTLTVVQVALSIVLGISAAVLARTVYGLANVNIGFDTRGLYSVPLRPGDIGYDDARRNEFFRAVERRLNATPGIAAATCLAPVWLVHILARTPRRSTSSSAP
jgi:hypothetical protein